MTLSPNEGVASKKYNLNCIYKRIKAFYKEKLNIIAEENFGNFDSKKAIDLKSELEFEKLLELLAGVTAQCDRREFFLEIMQKLNEPHSSILLDILTQKITKYIENDNDNNDINFLGDLDTSQNSEENPIDENLKLTEKIEALEIEKNILKEKLSNLIETNKSLKLEKEITENRLKDLNEKYNLLIDSLNYEKNKNTAIEKTDDVNLAIKISELKGIIEGKEKSFERSKKEKDEIIINLKNQIQNYKEELEILKEINIKYNYLEEKFKKFNYEESNKNFYKEKISQSEKKIIELEEQNKKLKNYDIDKIKLLEKAENLTNEINSLKNENSIFKRENQKYLRIIANKNENDKVDQNLIEQENSSVNILQLNTKVEILKEENNEIKIEKKDLEELVEKLNDDLNKTKENLEKLRKKEKKYNEMKQENKGNLTKLTQLIEENHKLKDQINNLKVQEKKITQVLETKLIVRITKS